MANPYEVVALKLVPIGSHPGVVELRESIAQVFEKEITRALRQQKEQQFPDLAATRQELETWRQELQKYKEGLDAREKKLQQGQRDLLRREEKLAGLIKAFEQYLAWLNGEGDVTENGKRFNALKEAYLTFKKENS